MQLSLGDVDERDNAAAQIHERVRFDRGLGLIKDSGSWLTTLPQASTAETL